MTCIALAPSSPPGAAQPVVLAGHSSWVNSVAVSDDGVVATAGNDGQIGLWRDTDGTRLAWLHLPRRRSPMGEAPLLAHLGVPAYSVAFDRGSRRLAAGCGDGAIHVADVATRQFIATLPDPSGHVNAVCWLSAHHLLAGTIDGRLVLWDVEHRARLAERPVFQFPIQGIALSPDGTSVAVASFDSRVRIVAVPGLDVTASLAGHKDVVYSVAWSGDGRYLASGSNDHTALLWDLRDQSSHPIWQGEAPVYAVAFTSDGERLAVAEQAQPIRILAVPSGRPLSQLSGHTADVVALAFTADGRLVSGARDATARIWSAEVTH
ncbi:MAG: WD40 repeat domain-containing protein [Nitrospirota bacterium]